MRAEPSAPPSLFGLQAADFGDSRGGASALSLPTGVPRLQRKASEALNAPGGQG
jgi:hypothetical protein